MANITRRKLIEMGAGLALTSGAVYAQTTQPSSSFPRPSRAARALLRNAIDIHTHLDPDSYGPNSRQAARALDVVDMARRARAAGMRGFVIKQHYDQTAQQAYLTRKAVPGVEVFGMLCCNRSVGGLNTEAVRHFGELVGGYGRIVSMPTWDAENYVRQSKTPDRAAVPIARDGVLLPETIALLETIAQVQLRDSDAKLALATGHVSPEEALLVIREAKRQGIERIVATHAMGHPIHMDVAQMKQVAELGAYVEFVANFMTGARATFTAKQYFEAIREIGPEHAILSSDSGQANHPFPDDLLARAAHELLEAGLSRVELRKILVENPATLLGLAQSVS
ncbi:MAG TPA: DUF6282 family protein [Steroidobacter sp.]|uniref:DUF6282 family protein n=1 Tax=Steroidobacter sp. TaxID=1978227 RepID=UPI002ED946C4